MRQGSPGARRPRGRHNGGNGGSNNQSSGGGSMRGGENRVRSASALRHQTFDSNGPDVRVRGNAWQVYEKYQSLARDAASAGDRVTAESYLQHAEHYYRITEAIEEATAAEQRQRNGGAAFGATQAQPEVPANYYTPDGQLAAGAPQPRVPVDAQPAAAPFPATTGAEVTFTSPVAASVASVTEKAPAAADAAEVSRRPAVSPVAAAKPSAFFAPDEEEDRDSGPQTLVAQR